MLNDFRNHVKIVEKEAGMSSMIEAHEGWAMAEYDRKRESQRSLSYHFCY